MQTFSAPYSALQFLFTVLSTKQVFTLEYNLHIVVVVVGWLIDYIAVLFMRLWLE